MDPLALASRILELHGTELQTRSEPKQGTTAWFLLPGERSAEPGLAPIGDRIAAETDRRTDVRRRAAAGGGRGGGRIAPPPVEIEEPERTSAPLAAAALAATAATSLAVTGIVPQLLTQPNEPAATRRNIAIRHPKKAERKETGERSGAEPNRGKAARVDRPLHADDRDGACREKQRATGPRTAREAAESVTPAPSPTPEPEPRGPGKSGEAPGHTKPPSR